MLAPGKTCLLCLELLNFFFLYLVFTGLSGKTEPCPGCRTILPPLLQTFCRGQTEGRNISTLKAKGQDSMQKFSFLPGYKDCLLQAFSLFRNWRATSVTFTASLLLHGHLCCSSSSFLPSFSSFPFILPPPISFSHFFLLPVIYHFSH